MRVVGIIPCRMASSRLPGKPLADICGHPMVWHVYVRACNAASLDAVYIASADREVIDAGRALGLPAIETSGRHKTGTDCVAEARHQVKADLYVNVQGDEPMIEAAAIDALIEAAVWATNASAVNGCAPITAPPEVLDHNVVKVLRARDGAALAYSRAAVPYPKGGTAKYFRQLGLYALRPSGLALFEDTAPGPLERTEGIEMLRLLENGKRVAMVEVESASIPVDTEADLWRVRRCFEAGEAA